MLHHPAQPVTRGRTLAVAGLVDDARRVLTAVDPIAPGPSVTNVSGDGTDERIELSLRVEGLDHDVTTLATLRVVAVVAHDEASDAVIGHIDDPHHRRLGQWVTLGYADYERVWPASAAYPCSADAAVALGDAGGAVGVDAHPGRTGLGEVGELVGGQVEVGGGEVVGELLDGARADDH